MASEPAPIQLVIFLGNPGQEYARTRHNAGFLVADSGFPPGRVGWQKKFKGEWATLPLDGQKLYLLKPLTFMNLAGESARALADFFQIPPQSWLAVHDDVELPFGEVRFQAGGGLGGHNGLRSLRQHGNTQEFYRLRLGVGRPVRGDLADYVLGRFTPDEEAALPLWLDRAAATLEEAILTHRA